MAASLAQPSAKWSCFACRPLHNPSNSSMSVQLLVRNPVLFRAGPIWPFASVVSSPNLHRSAFAIITSGLLMSFPICSMFRDLASQRMFVEEVSPALKLISI